MTVRFNLGGDRSCAECRRWVYADGSALTIEQAISKDIPPQVYAYLDELSSSNDRKKQIRFAGILVRFEAFSIYGELEPPRELNYLRGNLQEIKTQQDRVLFYEVPATANHRRAVRLTNACEKRVSKTSRGKLPRKHLELGEAIERIDRDV